MSDTGFYPQESPEFEMEDAMHPPLSTNPLTQLVCKQIVGEQLNEIKLQTPLALEGVDIEGVHKMRVGYRRLRTCVKIFKPLIKGNVYKFFQANTKQIRQLLGDIRDLDVLQENLISGSTIRDKPNTLAYWELKISPIYQQFRTDFIGAISSSQYATFLAYLEVFASDPQAGLKSTPKICSAAHNIQGFAPGFLQTSLYKILNEAPSFQNPQPYPTYHQLRKQLKHFRYAMEFFSSYLIHPNTEVFIENLVSLQDHLGQLNDAVVATKFFESNFPEIFQARPSQSTSSLRDYYANRMQEKEQLTNTFLAAWEEFLKAFPQTQLTDCFP